MRSWPVEGSGKASGELSSSPYLADDLRPRLGSESVVSKAVFFASLLSPSGPLISASCACSTSPIPSLQLSITICKNRDTDVFLFYLRTRLKVNSECLADERTTKTRRELETSEIKTESNVRLFFGEVFANVFQKFRTCIVNYLAYSDRSITIRQNVISELQSDMLKDLVRNSAGFRM